MTDDIDSTLWRVGNDIGTDYEIELRDCITSLEQRIAELESPKTCSTCLYFERSEHEFGHYEGTCLAFIIQNKDFQTVDDTFGCIEYRPKDKQ